MVCFTTHCLSYSCEVGAIVPLVGGDQKGYKVQSQNSALCLNLPLRLPTSLV